MNEWHRSSRCDTGSCVEVQFHKSTLSIDNGTCVEVASCACNQIKLRDSKDPEGPTLSFTPVEWDAFLAGVRNGEFDL